LEKSSLRGKKNFKNKNTNFIWSLKNKVLHLHPLREAGLSSQEILEWFQGKSVSSILTFQQEFEKGKILDKSKGNRKRTKEEVH